MKNQSLGQRMKQYEESTEFKLLPNMPAIIRVDGRAFHTLTKDMDKPFDCLFNKAMQDTMKKLCENVPTCVFGYTQSDEITLVLINKANNSELWFDNRIVKICSIVSAMATLFFNECLYNSGVKDELFKGVFDSRIFNIPKEDIVNNIIWRQEDATKNSINSVAHHYFNQKELNKKSCNQMQEMLMTIKGVNWNDYPTIYKRGCACKKCKIEIETPNGKAVRNKWFIDEEMPIISQNRNYVEECLRGDEK